MGEKKKIIKVKKGQRSRVMSHWSGAIDMMCPHLGSFESKFQNKLSHSLAVSTHSLTRRARPVKERTLTRSLIRSLTFFLISFFLTFRTLEQQRQHKNINIDLSLSRENNVNLLLEPRFSD